MTATVNKMSKSTKEAFRQIAEKAHNLDMSTEVTDRILDRANTLFTQVLERDESMKSLKVKRRDAVTSACLYIACKQEGTPWALGELLYVSERSNTSKKDIKTEEGVITEILGISVEQSSAADFVPRYCSNQGLADSVQNAAQHIAGKAEDLTAGRSPNYVAATAIYMACLASGNKKVAKKIARIIDKPLKESYRVMRPRAHQLFPEDFIFVTPIEELPETV